MNLASKNRLWLVIAIFMILPVWNSGFDTGVLFLFVSAAVMKRGLADDSFRKTYFSTRVFLCIGALFLFLVAGLILKMTGTVSGGGHRIGEFIVVISVFILALPWGIWRGWEKGCLHVPLLLGIWVLALYLADTALFPGFVALFGRDAETLLYMDMTAFLIFFMAAGLYLYSEDKEMRPVYVSGMAVSAFALAVNEAWGTGLLLFVMLVFHSAVIVPVAEIMKRLLQIFFGLGLFFCNMGLLANYSGVIHINGLQYSLECGIIGELFLFFWALYVFKCWDKIPDGVDLWRIKLDKLQRGCRRFGKGMVRLLAILAMLSLINGKLGTDNLIRLFAGDGWERIETDVFVKAVLSLWNHMYVVLLQMWGGNIFAVCHQMYGLAGTVSAVVFMGFLGYQLFAAVFRKDVTDDFLVWMAAGAYMALVFLPVDVYMLPAYFIFIFMLLNQYGIALPEGFCFAKGGASD